MQSEGFSSLCICPFVPEAFAEKIFFSALNRHGVFVKQSDECTRASLFLDFVFCSITLFVCLLPTYTVLVAADLQSLRCLQICTSS